MVGPDGNHNELRIHAVPGQHGTGHPAVQGATWPNLASTCRSVASTSRSSSTACARGISTMTPATWPQSNSPGSEQREFWHSSSADKAGSRNFIGLRPSHRQPGGKPDPVRLAAKPDRPYPRPRPRTFVGRLLRVPSYPSIPGGSPPYWNRFVPAEGDATLHWGLMTRWQTSDKALPGEAQAEAASKTPSPEQGVTPHALPISCGFCAIVPTLFGILLSTSSSSGRSRRSGGADDR